MSTIGITASSAPRAARVVRRSASGTRLRITARGRRALLTLAAAPVAAVIAVSALTGGSALASGEHSADAAFETVTVLPGDTLWSIAGEIAPDADPREVIADITRLNNLPSGMIQIGTELAIPLQYSS